MDLKDAYFTIPIAQGRKHFRLLWHTNEDIFLLLAFWFIFSVKNLHENNETSNDSFEEDKASVC